MAELPIWKKIIRKRVSSETEIIRFLSETAVFGRLPKRAMREIAKMVHLRNYEPEETIFRQGEAGAGFYLIYSGRVNIRSVRDGIELNLASLDQHAFFGELSMFSEDRRSATAVAVEPSVLLGFFKPDLMDIIARNPKVGIEIVMSLSNVIVERLSRTNSLLEKAYFKGKKRNV